MASTKMASTKNLEFRCGDRALIGAGLIAVLAAIPGIAVNAYTAHPAHRVQEAHPLITTSPAELALAGLARERKCLAEAMYYEARGEGSEGEMAIAEVVMTRMHDRNFPNTVCGVVYEGVDAPHHACQFSFTCDGSLDRTKNPAPWNRARMIARQIMVGTVKLGDLTDRATNYHNVSVDPVWAASMVPTIQIGNHIFYKPAPRTAPDSLNPASKDEPSLGQNSGTGSAAAVSIEPRTDIASPEIQPHI